jgi:hypothetical protein
MFKLFRQFDLFRTVLTQSDEPPEPGIPANALVTTDGIPLVTADGAYLRTEN